MTVTDENNNNTEAFTEQLLQQILVDAGRFIAIVEQTAPPDVLRLGTQFSHIVYAFIDLMKLTFTDASKYP